MAAIFALAGGLVGFGSGLVSLIFFDASVLTALAIWSGVGVGCMAVGLAIMIRREDTAQSGHVYPRARTA